MDRRARVRARDRPMRQTGKNMASQRSSPPDQGASYGTKSPLSLSAGSFPTAPTGSTAARIWSRPCCVIGPAPPPTCAVSTGQQDAYAGHEDR
ncbi:hypothetical protein Veis_0881 [Verminephrobacter eiseniae EF01-2]|uniref:Uncharacterized protein n=1 Tax=Verminephrobacter eiseniae (strain EF01-2) TaxID=391735 RepID=A1WGA3_VEREI|nr:hypothetical protein Veis_0881 [Verminephrobacter eiseniae EF01-2]